MCRTRCSCCWMYCGPSRARCGSTLQHPTCLYIDVPDGPTPQPQVTCTCSQMQDVTTSTQVPDVSAVIHTSDFPCIKEHRDVPDTEWRDKNQQVRSRLEFTPGLQGRCKPRHGSRLNPTSRALQQTKQHLPLPLPEKFAGGALHGASGGRLMTDSHNDDNACSCSCRRSTTTGTPSPFWATTARRASWTSCSPTSRTLGTSTARSRVRAHLGVAQAHLVHVSQLFPGNEVIADCLW